MLKVWTETGQSLMELTVVLAVAILVIGALTFATIASLRNAQFATNQAQATKLAQEGIEKVRIGRNRNQCINLPLTDTVNSWNGNRADCGPIHAGATGAIWDYRIDNGNCGNPSTTPPQYCYFNLIKCPANQASCTNQGVLNYLTSFTPSPARPYPPGTESIPPFNRTVILSDDLNYQIQKTVTVIVTWSDFSGQHESKLTTILGKP